MTQIDFAVGLLLTLIVVTYSTLSISSVVSNDFNFFTSKRLDQSASSLYKQLFEIQDNKSLISNFKKIQVEFTDIGGYSHTEQLNITISPIANKIHVYNKSMSEIISNKFTTSENVTVSFLVPMYANGKTYVDIFYFGSPTNKIDYTSDSLQTNVTARILSEEDVAVLSQEKCSKLKALNYEEAKTAFGFIDNFKVDSIDCKYGEEPSTTSSVVIKSIYMLIENKTDESLYSKNAKLMVW